MILVRDLLRVLNRDVASWGQTSTNRVFRGLGVRGAKVNHDIFALPLHGYGHFLLDRAQAAPSDDHVIARHGHKTIAHLFTRQIAGLTHWEPPFLGE